MTSLTRCIEKKITVNWTPWRWHHYMPKQAGVEISVWFGIYCIVHKSWFMKCCYITVLQFFLCIINKLTNGSLWHSTQTLPRHSLHSECHMVLQHICKWAFIYAYKKMITFILCQFSLHTEILDLVLFWSLVLNFAENQIMNVQSMYEGWNFNFGNAAVTFDTAHLQSSYFHRPSMYSKKLCRTRSQRWGSCMMPLEAPVLLMVRTERSTAEGLNPTYNCPIR